MKRAVFFVAFLCCMTMISQQTWAQGELKDITTITQKEIKTTHTLQEDIMSLSLNLYEDEALLTGLINTKIGLMGDNEQNILLKEPANQLVEITFTDPYERKPVCIRDTSSLSSFCKEILRSDYYYIEMNKGFTIVRGGQYVYRTNIPCIDYNYEKEVEIIDEPTVRLKAGKMKVGKDIELQVHYNTGYPYDPSQYTGKETAAMRLFSLGKDEQGNNTETELAMTQKTLRLHRPDQPLVAAIDVLQLNYADPEPGEYRVKTTSDLTHKNANRDDIFFIVSDTLRATATMQKMSYEVGKDNGLKIHMKMNFGYPYIKASAGDDVPTVHVKTQVVIPADDNGLLANVTLLESTTPITEGVFSDRPLNWEGDIVTAALESLEEAPLEEKRMKLHVVVSFNDDVQYNTTIPFDYIPQTAPSSIKSIPSSESATADTWHDLQGRPVATSTTSGIYIHNRQKVVIK